MISLSEEWKKYLLTRSETGMGYQVVSVILNDGRKFDQIVVMDGHITQVRGISGIPFASNQIAQVIVTHDKWNFSADKKD